MSTPRYTGPQQPDSVPDPEFYGDRFGATNPGDLNPNNGNTSTEMDNWIRENVTKKGLVLDEGTGDILDPSTFPPRIIGHLPSLYPRM